MDNCHRYFATTVALITTSGSKYGPNVMAAEWTMQVSYDPMTIAVFVHESPTYWNIAETRTFGVNLASDDQAELVNLAGGYSGTELKKLSIPGAFTTYRASIIKDPMIRGCALNAECKVAKIQKVGDHIMVLGSIVAAKFDETKFPLVYTRGNYRSLSRSKIQSGRTRVRLSPTQLAHFQRLAGGQFVLKAAACVARSRGKILLQKFGDDWTVPFVVVRKGQDYAQSLERYLRSIGLAGNVGRMARLSRMALTDDKTSSSSSIRANFVAYRCSIIAADPKDGEDARWFDRLPRNTLLRRQLLQDA